MADYFKDGGTLIIDAMPEPRSCLMTKQMAVPEHIDLDLGFAEMVK